MTTTHTASRPPRSSTPRFPAPMCMPGTRSQGLPARPQNTLPRSDNAAPAACSHTPRPDRTNRSCRSCRRRTTARHHQRCTAPKRRFWTPSTTNRYTSPQRTAPRLRESSTPSCCWQSRTPGIRCPGSPALPRNTPRRSGTAPASGRCRTPCQLRRCPSYKSCRHRTTARYRRHCTTRKGRSCWM